MEKLIAGSNGACSVPAGGPMNFSQLFPTLIFSLIYLQELRSHFHELERTEHCPHVSSVEIRPFKLYFPVLSEVKVTIKRGLNGSLVNCIVKANPPPEISWKNCNINETASCKPIKTNMAMKQVHNQSHVYMSSILLNKSHEHIINCVVNNSFWRKKGSYTYKLDSDKAKGNYFASRDT